MVWGAKKKHEIRIFTFNIPCNDTKLEFRLQLRFKIGDLQQVCGFTVLESLPNCFYMRIS